MSIVVRAQAFLLRLSQEEAAVRNARSVEARIAHQGIVVHLRRTIDLIAREPRVGG